MISIFNQACASTLYAVLWNCFQLSSFPTSVPVKTPRIHQAGRFPAGQLRTGVTTQAPTADINQDNENQSDNTVYIAISVKLINKMLNIKCCYMRTWC